MAADLRTGQRISGDVLNFLERQVSLIAAVLPKRAAQFPWCHSPKNERLPNARDDERRDIDQDMSPAGTADEIEDQQPASGFQCA